MESDSSTEVRSWTEALDESELTCIPFLRALRDFVRVPSDKHPLYCVEVSRGPFRRFTKQNELDAIKELGVFEGHALDFLNETYWFDNEEWELNSLSSVVTLNIQDALVFCGLLWLGMHSFEAHDRHQTLSGCRISRRRRPLLQTPYCKQGVASILYRTTHPTFYTIAVVRAVFPPDLIRPALDVFKESDSSGDLDSERLARMLFRVLGGTQAVTPSSHLYGGISDLFRDAPRRPFRVFVFRPVQQADRMEPLQAVESLLLVAASRCGMRTEQLERLKNLTEKTPETPPLKSTTRTRRTSFSK